LIKWISRAVLIGLLLVAVVGTAYAGFNWSEVSKKGTNVTDKVVTAGQTQDDQEIEDATNSSGGSGMGFYMTIYEDAVRNPNEKVKDEIMKRFGIEFDVDLSPLEQSGQYFFANFLKDPLSRQKSTAAPTIKDSLLSACVRIKTAQVDDEIKRWRMVQNRLKERELSYDASSQTAQATSEAAAVDQSSQVDKEIVTRLLGFINDEIKVQREAAINSIPEYKDLGEVTDKLLLCYEDFSAEVDFELRLQTLLHPSKKKLEVMHTFVNGSLDDFQSMVPGTDVSYGSSFPKYDLLFDIDVIDLIIFGSPVGIDQGSPGGGEFGGFAVDSDDFDSYQELEGVAQPPTGDGSVAGGTDPVVNTGAPGAPDAGVAAEVDSSTVPDLSGVQGGGFGASSGAYGGPFCPIGDAGIDLDYSTVGNPPSVDDDRAGAGDGTQLADLDDTYDQAGTGTTVQPSGAGGPGGDTGAAVDGGGDVEADSDEGHFKDGINSETMCAGTMGVDFGNDMLRMLFCINISFDKVGKTWEKVQEENCIACHIYKINQIFEEEVLASSVRPHKNTGTVMESTICEDGYGDDIGFFSFIEWVPVKFYPEICYPKGGVTDEYYAELIGFPEIFGRFNSGDTNTVISCDNMFTDEDANKLCKEAIGGDSLSYADFSTAYKSSIDLENPLVDLDDADMDNVWNKLAGARGVAEKELHVFLYRLGKVEARWDEEEKIQKQDLKICLDSLDRRMNEIMTDNSIRDPEAAEVNRAKRLLELKGYHPKWLERSQNTQQQSSAQSQSRYTLDCESNELTYEQVYEVIERERLRVAKIMKRWNNQSDEFSEENNCNKFSGKGVVDAFIDAFEDRVDGGYFFETEERKSMTLEEQITGQVVANMDLSDISNIFSEIDNKVIDIREEQTSSVEQQNFASDQSQSMQLFNALGTELLAFKMNLRAYTKKWLEIVGEKKFVSKGGEKITCLQSFEEKLR